MQTNFIKRIVISAKNKPIGIITERDVSRFLEHDNTARPLDEIPVKEIMKKNLITVTSGQQDLLEQCIMRMDTFRIGSVIIVDGNGYLEGIATKTDVTKSFAENFPGKSHVKEFMNTKVFTCRKTDSIKFALNVINRNDVSRLAVTDNDGVPIGVITTNSFLIHSNYFKKKSNTRNYLFDESQKELLVGDLIGDELLTVNYEDDLAKAAQMMIDNKISGIPVTDYGKGLVGMITKFDVLSAYNKANRYEDIVETYKRNY